MTRIEDGKPGRRGRGYYRLFNDAELSALMSRIHGAVISAGHELERLISAEAPTLDDLDMFLDNGDEGVFLVTKKAIKASRRLRFPGSEPDYLIFDREGRRRLCYVVELKDGDMFDTKKARGEVQSLREFVRQIGAAIPYRTDYRVCSFNQMDRQAIADGFKREVDIDHVWTGRDLCALLDIDYDAMVAARNADATANRQWLASSIVGVPALRDALAREIARDPGMRDRIGTSH